MPTGEMLSFSQTDISSSPAREWAALEERLPSDELAKFGSAFSSTNTTPTQSGIDLLELRAADAVLLCTFRILTIARALGLGNSESI